MGECESHTIKKVQHEHYRCKVCGEMFVKSDKLIAVQQEVILANRKVRNYETILRPLRLLK